MRIAIVFAVVALAACQGEPLQALVPAIAIGDPIDPAASVCATARVRDCRADLGDVVAGASALLSFTIEDPSRTGLRVQSVTITGSPSFALEGVIPGDVEPGEHAVVTVRFTPAAATDESAEIVVKSDAGNLDPGADVVIDVAGRGVDAGAPAVAVEPGACDFGPVGLGARALCALSIANTGTRALRVSGLDLDDGGVFSVDAAPTLPADIQPGTAVTASFAAVPVDVDARTGTLHVASDDPERPVVDVPFVVRGAEAPTAVARVARINGTDNASSTPAVEPLDDVVLSGDQSAGYGGALVTAWHWTLLEKPAESSVVLSAPDAVETGFVFSSAAGDVSGVDVAGTFRVGLTVTDSTGAVSQNDAAVTLNAVPTEGLHLQLTWSVDEDDLDLHLGRDIPVDWCGHDDCYYGNCEGSALDWDGPGSHAGDPTLDIDDTRGFGPENISIDAPVDGNYVIVVHAYDGNGGAPGFAPADVTVKVFVGGALVQQFLGHLDARNQFWHVARIDVAGGQVSITPVDHIGGTPSACAS